MQNKNILLISFFIIFTFVLPAYAEEVLYNGDNCGEDCHWQITSDGKLIISGNGKMNDTGYASSPWFSYSNNINEIIIEEGITHLGGYMLVGLDNATTISLPNSLTSIGAGVFYNTPITELTIPNSVTLLGNNSLAGSNFSTVIIPESVEFIPSGILGVCYDCDTSIEEIYCSQEQLSNGICQESKFQTEKSLENMKPGYYVKNTDGTLSLYDSKGVYVKTIESPWKSVQKIKKTSYTIQEANEATPNPDGVYSVKLTW